MKRQHDIIAKGNTLVKSVLLFYFFVLLSLTAGAQEKRNSLFLRVDSMLTLKYRKGDIDTAYITRPQTKWTLVGRLNVSGAKIETEGVESDRHFNSEMTADYKSTISFGVSYLGLSVNMALNPAKLMGKYHDYEININSYGKRYGFDFIYQDARNFSGWTEWEDMERLELREGIMKMKTLNLNAYYAFNSRHFSYPAAFSYSYIQRRSAGSFLLAASGQGQRGTINGTEETKFKMTNIGIGAGYAYNWVPSQNWLLHISALPTFIVYSKTYLSFGESRVPLHYHFPEVIITGRGAIVRQSGRTFYGMSMVFNFTNVGNEKSLAVHNIKWSARAFFGVRF